MLAYPSQFMTPVCNQRDWAYVLHKIDHVQLITVLHIKKTEHIKGKLHSDVCNGNIFIVEVLILYMGQSMYKYV